MDANRIKIGMITYNCNHLKTEQIFTGLQKYQNVEIKIFALPFVSRPTRQVLFHHRPSMSDGIHTFQLAQENQLPFIDCKSDLDIDSSCDFYLVCGAGILSAECVQNKKIINCHPGIIPSCRGLDAFKWAIYEKYPLGNTLHLISPEVDAGEIISIIPTKVYSTDSLASLARRHYESEIDILSNFLFYLQNPINNHKNLPVYEPKRRMPQGTESELSSRFLEYKSSL